MFTHTRSKHERLPVQTGLSRAWENLLEDTNFAKYADSIGSWVMFIGVTFSHTSLGEQKSKYRDPSLLPLPRTPAVTKQRSIFTNVGEKTHTAASKSWTGTPSLANATAHVNPHTPPPTMATLKSLEVFMEMRDKFNWGYLIRHPYMMWYLCDQQLVGMVGNLYLPKQFVRLPPTGRRYYTAVYWCWALTLLNFHAEPERSSAIPPIGDINTTEVSFKYFGKSE